MKNTTLLTALYDYIALARKLPPHIVVKKAVRLFGKKLSYYRRRNMDHRQSTFLPRHHFDHVQLARYFSLPADDLLQQQAPQIAALTARYLDHNFDLLGSGWRHVRHGMRCVGVEGYCYPADESIRPDPDGAWLTARINPPNRTESQRIWRLLDPAYVPIDWQLDFKSGYRWAESTWYLEIPYGHLPGVDIKVPWELARMQHLPQLAWAYRLAGQNQACPERSRRAGFHPSDVYAREFRHQVLDFIAVNPPRFGVNWRTTMDVAIRAVNWLIAYDLFRAAGVQFDPDFERELARSLYQHGQHIVRNLEWSAQLRGNHYLADIAGLLFISAFWPRTPETDAWLALAAQELIVEARLQFNPDGSSFEGSTSYHRLSAEMLVYAAALLCALSSDKLAALREYDCRRLRADILPPFQPAPAPIYTYDGYTGPLPAWFWPHLTRIAEFTLNISDAAGHIAQFGDNDSGRFVKVQPALSDDRDLTDDILDHRHLPAAINGLTPRPDFARFGSQFRLETDLVRRLAGRTFSSAEAASERSRIAYPDFGLYILHHPPFQVVIRCGSVGQFGNGGHAHNDQLSFELRLDNLPVIVDSGTYLYTPRPDLRNRFRATAAHNTLEIVDLEQNTWRDTRDGLFSLTDMANARVLAFETARFLGEHTGFGQAHRRTLSLSTTEFRGVDECRANGQKWLHFHIAPGVQIQVESDRIRLGVGERVLWFQAFRSGVEIRAALYSRGYGHCQAAQKLSVPMLTERLEWRFWLE